MSDRNRHCQFCGVNGRHKCSRDIPDWVVVERVLHGTFEPMSQADRRAVVLRMSARGDTNGTIATRVHSASDRVAKLIAEGIAEYGSIQAAAGTLLTP